MNLSAWAAGAAWASRRAVLSRGTWAVVAVVVVIVGGSLGYGFSRGRSNPPAAAPRAVAPTHAPKPKPETGFRVIVPSIGADAPIIPTGASGPGGGALDVPSSVHVVGWWDGIYTSPTGKVVHEKVAAPGQSGVALLAGHVDSATQGNGVFYRLVDAKPGAAVTVIDQKNKVTHWKVTRVQTVLKSALPAALFVDKGKPQLALVSCGGPFNGASGHYLDNIIAWAVPVTTTAPA